MITETKTAIRVSASSAALAWTNAFLATGQDKERPLLFRKLSLEVFTGGVQFIGCNGSALFRTWVPSTYDDWDSEWPETDVPPEETIVVSDGDGFGLAFMRTVLSVTKDDAHIAEELTFEIGPIDEREEPSLGEEMVRQRLALCACGQRLELEVFEATFPDWRNLQLGIDSVERVERLAIATKVFGLLGKLKGVETVDLDFHGEDKAVVFDAGPVPMVRGLLMPCRRPDKEE
jgi:hypothetical protein